MGKPEVAFREAISKKVRCEHKYVRQTGGHGQYGHVIFDIEPGERGSGFKFENAVVGGTIPREFVPSIEKGLKDAIGRGVLAGYPLIDVNARLIDGSFQGGLIGASLRDRSVPGFPGGAQNAGCHLPRAIMKGRDRDA